MRRVVLLSLLLVVPTLAGLIALRLGFAERHRINDESFKKIAIGMTLEEVEAVFGAPATVSVGAFGGLGILPQPRIWSSDYHNQKYLIYFDDEGRVRGTGVRVVYELDESWLEKFRRWLGLR